jgi:hypothetical protein
MPGYEIGTLTWIGNCKINILNIRLEPYNMTTRLHVVGNLDLTGSTLNVSELPCVAPGLYYMLTWTGSLTGTFAQSNLPPGYNYQFPLGLKSVTLTHTYTTPTITCPPTVTLNNTTGLCENTGVALSTPVA